MVSEVTYKSTRNELSIIDGIRSEHVYKIKAFTIEDYNQPCLEVMETITNEWGSLFSDC